MNLHAPARDDHDGVEVLGEYNAHRQPDQRGERP